LIVLLGVIAMLYMYLLHILVKEQGA